MTTMTVTLAAIDGTDEITITMSNHDSAVDIEINGRVARICQFSLMGELEKMRECLRIYDGEVEGG